jgi:hypothetical protein
LRWWWRLRQRQGGRGRRRCSRAWHFHQALLLRRAFLLLLPLLLERLELRWRLQALRRSSALHGYRLLFLRLLLIVQLCQTLLLDLAVAPLEHVGVHVRR